MHKSNGLRKKQLVLYRLGFECQGNFRRLAVILQSWRKQQAGRGVRFVTYLLIIVGINCSLISLNGLK